MSQYKHVALIGLGLLAGSISLAMRRAGMEAKITGTARSNTTRFMIPPLKQWRGLT